MTSEDILEAVGGLAGHERNHTLTVIRSLFRHCKKNRTIFRDPAARLRVGERPRSMILPLDGDDIDQVVSAAQSPLDRLILALAAIHAARTQAIRELQVDDIDLGNRRLTIAGRTRPLDDLTHQVILDWLSHRSNRWPDTANPHLIINKQTAMETGPVSKVWLTTPVTAGSLAEEDACGAGKGSASVHLSFDHLEPVDIETAAVSGR